MTIAFRRRSCAALLVIAAGCAADPEPVEFANGLAPSDPAFVGQEQFLYWTWDTEILDEWPPASFMLGLMEDEPEVFGDQFSKFGFIPDPTRDFPIGLARGTRDPDKIHETCAQCHVARLPDGRLWLGAPNSKLDVGRFRVEVDRRWVAAGNPPMLTALSADKKLRLGPGRASAESSTYSKVVPADFPPYFDLGRRTHMNYMGTGQNVRTEIFFSLFTFGAGNPNPQMARVKFPSDAETDTLVAFMGSLQAPPAPAQDAALVARGAEVFVEARCDTCHHLDDIGLDGVVPLDTSTTGVERYPGDDPAFPDGAIRTSRAHRVLQDGDPDEPGGGPDSGLGDLLQFIFDNQLAVRRTDGYRVNDLHGLWATAPYLHNGSVPTLMDLLTPAAERPTKWMNATFEVDTTQFGNDNAGHEFGSDLPAADKEALVAYLLSL